MKKAITAVLLSGFVFPGIGQLYLGRKYSGLGFILATNIGLACLVFTIVRRIPLILEKVQPELEQGADITTVVEASLRHASIGAGSFLESAALVILGLSWLLAVVHAWRAGRSQNTGLVLKLD